MTAAQLMHGQKLNCGTQAYIPRHMRLAAVSGDAVSVLAVLSMRMAQALSAGVALLGRGVVPVPPVPLLLLGHLPWACATSLGHAQCCSVNTIRDCEHCEHTPVVSSNPGTHSA